ncbi:MAG: hypothetical protein Q4F54_03970 [Coriobacteriia bacterium]|nr:hypothetical protein [Coriobacteriia bacterium]
MKRTIEPYSLSGSSPYTGSAATANTTLTGPDHNLVTGETVSLTATTKGSTVGVYRYDGTDRSTLDFTIN